MFFSLSSTFYFIGNKIATEMFKEEIESLIKAKGRLRIYQNMAMNHVIDEVNP